MKFERTERFKEAYCSLGEIVQHKVNKALRLMVTDPRHPSLHLKKMRGTSGLWEVRVDRGHRITLSIDGDCYVLRNVGKHDETLREL
ncbi:MAG: hypothetical protein M1133_03070 [Armatimonadetes bacterium]|nr:hypothetical protein [Armatimonadota bacterium]